jgi:hypothetical protein
MLAQRVLAVSQAENIFSERRRANQALNLRANGI